VGGTGSGREGRIGAVEESDEPLYRDDDSSLQLSRWPISSSVSSGGVGVETGLLGLRSEDFLTTLSGVITDWRIDTLVDLDFDRATRAGTGRGGTIDPRADLWE